ncbi:hypothetical protein [Actinorugispora endophytica]|uniref:Uncharacterized protein n=1 Tax=Actinorugispora endophytica TaxID=1605990 RepID=A0A4R6UZQ1_9ACTN|nr:hypothetical protein [Actinorugispora endophytica]TDQ53072.1 hypothetical protein EV190_105194 [Actinorugispora endophytica]
MGVLGRLGVYGLVLVAGFGGAFWVGALVGPVVPEPPAAHEQEQVRHEDSGSHEEAR